MPLAAAFSCLSFSIARLTYLWAYTDRFSDLATRVVEDHRRLLPKRRTFDPATLLPIWTSLWALQGVEPYTSGRSADPTSQIVAALREVASGNSIGRAIQAHISQFVPTQSLRIFDSNLSAEEKVRSFDVLVGSQLDAIQPMFLKEFVVGAAASDISSGGLSHIELVGEHVERLPGALLWYGTLAGLVKDLHWSADFDGLGRSIEKALVRSFDWEGMPECDIALSELLLDEASDGSLDLRQLRGSSNRFVEVELYPGVNAVVPLSEATAPPPPPPPNRNGLTLPLPRSPEPTSQPKLRDVMALISRMEVQFSELRQILSSMNIETIGYSGPHPKRQSRGRKR
jgi:hypothetical protein